MAYKVKKKVFIPIHIRNHDKGVRDLTTGYFMGIGK
jgi:hypothetical protein